jgi:hypothetical protein
MAHHLSETASEPLVGNARIEKIEERGQEGFDLVDSTSRRRRGVVEKQAHPNCPSRLRCLPLAPRAPFRTARDELVAGLLLELSDVKPPARGVRRAGAPRLARLLVRPINEPARIRWKRRERLEPRPSGSKKPKSSRKSVRLHRPQPHRFRRGHTRSTAVPETTDRTQGGTSSSALERRAVCPRQKGTARASPDESTLSPGESIEARSRFAGSAPPNPSSPSWRTSR